MTERPIDHLVLPVTTLTLARSRLTGLGFTVAPDARHPFGTANCCVFFQNRTFLEPITIADRAVADMSAAQGMLFVKRIKRFTERHGEGFAMLALNSTDAETDRANFESAGFGVGATFRFSRLARLPDGSEKEIGFALAHTATAASPDASFFACQHLAPDILFQPAYLEHPNGAIGVVAVAAVAESPAEFEGLVAAATGLGAADIASGAGKVALLTPRAFRERYAVEPPDPRRGLLLAAFDLAVTDLDRAAGYAGASAKRHEGAIIVPPSPGIGATFAFKAQTDG